MNEEIRDLYRRAEREMRPELLARVVAMLDGEAPDRDRRSAARPSAEADADTVIDIPIPPTTTGDTDVQRGRGDARGRRAAWVLLAAAVLAFVIAATVPTGGDEHVLPGSDAPVVSAGRPPCAESSAPVGVAPTRGVAIRVGLLPDGWTFCLTDDETGGWLEQVSLVGSEPEDYVPVDAPTILKHGVAGDGAYYVLLQVPEFLPVVDVTAPGHRVTSFPSRLGRRLLVIDPDYHPSRAIAHEEHQLSLRSAAGTVLASVTLPRIAGAAPAASAGAGASLPTSGEVPG